MLARISVLAALGRRVELRTMFQARATSRIPSTKIVETLLQVHLFGGFPAAIEGLRVLNDAYPGMIRHSHTWGARITLHQRRRRGVATCKRVYGPKYDDLLTSMQDLHPDLCVWMIEDGYGKVLSRPGLTLAERELITVATLACLDWPRQLRSHVKGCLNAGTDRRSIMAILRSIQVFLPRRRYPQGAFCYRTGAAVRKCLILTICEAIFF